MNTINLVPPDWLRRRESGRLIRTWTRRLVVTVGVLAALLAVMLDRVGTREEEANRLRDRYLHLQEEIRIAENLIEERDRLAGRRRAIHAIEGNQVTSRLLVMTGQALPPESYLNELSFESEGGQDSRSPSAGSTLRLILNGFAPGHATVGEIMRGLQSNGVFESIDLLSVSERGAAADRRLEFRIVCTLDEEWDDG